MWWVKRPTDSEPGAGLGSPLGPGLAGAGLAGADLAAPDLAAAVVRAQQGDQEAFRALYRDAQPRLLRYLHALVGDDAEDVASETWLQGTRHLGGFTGDYDGFRGWIATIARHRAMDHLRRHARRPPAIPVPVESLSGRAAADDTAEGAMETVSTGAALAL